MEHTPTPFPFVVFTFGLAIEFIKEFIKEFGVRPYLLGNKYVFYVDHMVLLYIIKKPQVF
jgi:hypothetical protein